MGRVCGSLSSVFCIVHVQALNITGYSLPSHANDMGRILCQLELQVFLNYIIKCYYNTNKKESFNTNKKESFHPAERTCAATVGDSLQAISSDEIRLPMREVSWTLVL